MVHLLNLIMDIADKSHKIVGYSVRGIQCEIQGGGEMCTIFNLYTD